MIRLVHVEFTRLRWRRAVLALVVIALLVPVAVLLARTLDTARPSESELATAREAVASEQAFIDDAVERCVARSDVDTTAQTERRCRQRFDYQPRVRNYLYTDTLRVAEERSNSGLAVVAIVAVLMLIAGTTFVGHDWNTGSMSNQLLFEPRRLRVWFAKAIAVALLALLVAVVALAILWVGLVLVARSRDLDPSGQVLTDIAQHAARGAVVVVAAAVGGYALTTLVRSTVFTIGVLFVVVAAGGLIFAALLPSSALRFEPATNALAVVQGRAEYYVEVPATCYDDNVPARAREECRSEREITLAQGSGYYAVLLLALGAVSAGSFRRRDVT